MKIVSRNTEEKIKNYSISQYPKEACGFVLKNGEFIELENLHCDPENNFLTDPLEYMKYEKELEFIFHSHTGLENICPSKADMENQLLFNVPWLLLATDGKRCTNLEVFGWQVIRNGHPGLDFIHGIRDCYSLIRDYYYNSSNEESKILLKEIPRENKWWVSKENLYLNHFKENGFFEVEKDISKIKVGDVCLMEIRPTNTVNHAGIYVGNGYMLHHLYGQLSCKTPIQNYIKFLNKIIRYDYDNPPKRCIWTDPSKVYKA